MTLSEKIAYLKGLAEGMKLDPGSSPEAKLISLMLDVLEHMALSVEDLDDSFQTLTDEVDELESALDELPAPPAHGRPPHCPPWLDDSFDDDELEGGELDDDGGEVELDEVDDEDFFEVDCPICGDTLMLDESILLAGEVTCPGCGQLLAVDVSIEAEEEAGGETPEE